jgi:uncharacterized damage-inducible protein DinB
MHVNEALVRSFEQVKQLVHGTVADLGAEALVWRPDPQANSIAWLVWHLTRIQDDHVSEMAGHEQVWAADGWAERFGLPDGSMDTGFGYSPEQVAAIDPGDPQVLVAYQDQAARETTDYIEGLDTAELDRVIDRSFEPAVTVGVRLTSVIGDSLQHVGQAAYVRGLFERRA